MGVVAGVFVFGVDDFIGGAPLKVLFNGRPDAVGGFPDQALFHLLSSGNDFQTI